MTARGTLLLRTLLRSFELGRSPSTAPFPTSRFPLPSPGALAIPSLCVSTGVGRRLFFPRVRAADSFHEGEPAVRGIGGEKSAEAGSESGVFSFIRCAHVEPTRWEGRLEFGHRADLFSGFDPAEDPLLYQRLLECRLSSAPVCFSRRRAMKFSLVNPRAICDSVLVVFFFIIIVIIVIIASFMAGYETLKLSVPITRY